MTQDPSVKSVLDVAHQTIEAAGCTDSDEYQLMIVVPERLEVRSFGLKVAEEPIHWSPVILERGEAGEWQQTN